MCTFSFPSARCDVVKKWLQALRREDFFPTPNSVVCSDHFSSADFVSSAKLKPEAVPSVFNFPSHLMVRDNVVFGNLINWLLAPTRCHSCVRHVPMFAPNVSSSASASICFGKISKKLNRHYTTCLIVHHYTVLALTVSRIATWPRLT